MTAPGYRVALRVEPAFARRLRRRSLAGLARRTLAAEGIEAPAELSIVVTDDETVRELNSRYRDMDAATDVLSFDMKPDGGFVTPPGSARQMGEIFISYPTAARQAEDSGRDIDEELSHLVVHGVLHLLGYDHESPEEARLMWAREEALLGFALRLSPKGRAAH